jgi:hypothetical protein
LMEEIKAKLSPKKRDPLHQKSYQKIKK